MPMLPVPIPILKKYEAILEKRAAAPIKRADYKKWLQNLPNGMPPSPSSQRRSKHGITPEKRLKPTLIGHASFGVF